MQTDEVVKKVAKLLRKARDRAATEAEAALYASKAQQLLDEHKLSMADVETEDGASMHEEHVAKKLARWEITLLIGVAKSTYAEVIRTVGVGYALIGRPADVAVARNLYRFLARQIRTLAEQSGADSTAFREGLGIGVNKRLMDAFRSRLAGNGTLARWTGEAAAALRKQGAVQNKKHRPMAAVSQALAAGIFASKLVRLHDEIDTKGT